ncbi:MAG: hypothetical protein IM638_04350 [Bacteroidetes bacterium]|nr:hypothetical protein [Bacteroidota bacterium]
MLRTLVFAFVAVLLFQSCSNAPAPRTFTEADYTKFADSLGFAIRNADTSFLMAHFHMQHIQDNFVKQVKASLLAAEDARKQCQKEVNNVIITLAERPDREFFKHLHTVRNGDTATYYFRSFHSNLTEYLSVDVVPGASGLLISDLMLFNTGMSFSETIVDFYRSVFVDDNKLLPGNDALNINTEAIANSIRAVQINLYQGDFSEAMNIIRSLPSPVQETITVQQYEMLVCAVTGDSMRAERLRKRTEGFSKTKNARCLLLYRVYAYCGNAREALKCCDQAEAILKDPMIDLLRAPLYVAVDEIDKAEASLLRAKKATGNEHRQVVYSLLLKLYVRQDNTDKAIETAKEMIDQAAFDKNDLYGYFILNPDMAADPRVSAFFD